MREQMHPNRDEADRSKKEKLSRMYADGGTVSFQDKIKAAADAVANSTAVIGKALDDTNKAVTAPTKPDTRTK